MKNKTRSQSQPRGVHSPRTRGASPGPHSGEGRHVVAGLLAKRAKPQTPQKRKAKATKEKHRNTLAASRPKTRKGRASSSPASSRRIQKTHGAQKGTPRKRQQKGRTAKMGDKPNAAGQKREKQQTNNKCVWGCPVTT